MAGDSSNKVNNNVVVLNPIESSIICIFFDVACCVTSVEEHIWFRQKGSRSHYTGCNLEGIS